MGRPEQLLGVGARIFFETRAGAVIGLEGAVPEHHMPVSFIETAVPDGLSSTDRHRLFLPQWITSGLRSTRGRRKYPPNCRFQLLDGYRLKDECIGP